MDTVLAVFGSISFYLLGAVLSGKWYYQKHPNNQFDDELMAFMGLWLVLVPIRVCGWALFGLVKFVKSDWSARGEVPIARPDSELYEKKYQVEMWMDSGK